MFGWLKSSSKITTPSYSLRIKPRFRELVEVFYSEDGRKYCLSGERVGREWRQINLSMPRTFPVDDLERVVGNLAAGLRKLGHEFVIYKIGDPLPVPADEQSSAVAKLQEIGYEPVVSASGIQITLEKSPTWRAPALEQAKRQAPELMRLIWAVSGKRPKIEVLAKSESAIVDFI